MSMCWIFWRNKKRITGETDENIETVFNHIADFAFGRDPELAAAISGSCQCIWACVDDGGADDRGDPHPAGKRSGGYLNRTDAGHVYPGGGRADDCLGVVASDGRSGDCYHLCHHPPCHGSNRACDPKGH